MKEHGLKTSNVFALIGLLLTIFLAVNSVESRGRDYTDYKVDKIEHEIKDTLKEILVELKKHGEAIVRIETKKKK